MFFNTAVPTEISCRTNCWAPHVGWILSVKKYGEKGGYL